MHTISFEVMRKRWKAVQCNCNMIHNLHHLCFVEMEPPLTNGRPIVKSRAREDREYSVILPVWLRCLMHKDWLYALKEA